jgi:hypothetical protein
VGGGATEGVGSSTASAGSVYARDTMGTGDAAN